MTIKTLNKTRYSFRNIEKKYNSANNITKNPIKALNLVSMFPFSSGSSHVGHLRNYKLTDVVARYNKLIGKDVFVPMGFDSFGLPGEEAAKKHNMSPHTWTEKNIKTLTEDFKNANFMLNWDHSLATHNSKYYKLQQKIIIAFYKKGLLERKKAYVNWDPVLKTVLANEQVDINGKSWKSGAKVERKLITQWFLKVTNYVDELLDGLKDLDWPNRVKKAQKSWIGKSKGTEITFINEKKSLKVFTTCPETVYGVTFLVMSPECESAKDYKVKPNQKGPIDYFKNPYNGKKIPLYFADYVLAEHGTGVVMGVPSADARDKKFAQEMKLEAIEILNNDGKLINSQELNGLSRKEGKAFMYKKLGTVTKYRIKDWCISRQRYWGTPMPFIHCEKCGIIPDEKGVKLPYISFDKPLDGNPLDSQKEWVNVDCPKCKEKARRSTETMDTFVDSSWYYLRYPVVNGKEILTPKAIDLYVGGIEHAALHLIYTRTFYLMLRDCGFLGEKYPKHPIKKLFCQGMVLGPTYTGKKSGKYYSPLDIKRLKDKFVANGEEIIVSAPVKISKSLNNGIPLKNLLDQYGSDVLGTFIISDTPPEKDSIFSLDAINGCYKFLQRAWKWHWVFQDKETTLSFAAKDDQGTIVEIERLFHNLTKAIEKLKLNVYISDLRKLLNILDNLNQKITYKSNREYFIKWIVALYPTAPAISEHLLEEMGKKLSEVQWPTGKIINNTSKIVMQINGLTKAVAQSELTGKEAVTYAQKHLKLEKYKKLIHIVNKQQIINFVL